LKIFFIFLISVNVYSGPLISKDTYNKGNAYLKFQIGVPIISIDQLNSLLLFLVLFLLQWGFLQNIPLYGELYFILKNL